MTKNLKIILKSKIKGQKVYTRLLAHKKDDLKKADSFLRPIDSQKNISIEYLNNNKKIESKGWFLVTKDNKQEFMVSSNSLVRVFCRYVVADSDISNYTMKVRENGQWIGNYMFDKVLTENEAKIITNYKNIKSNVLSKTRSFYLSVPYSEDTNYSYYSFSLSDTADQNEKILIKIIEYEKSDK